MKSCYCPICGKPQEVEVEPLPKTKVKFPCHGCGQSLVVRIENDEIIVSAKKTPPKPQNSGSVNNTT